jgi:CSLREA domain-containing protein
VSFGPGRDGTLYVGRDANNLYVGLKVADAGGTAPSSDIYFDNNDDGTRAVGDDLWDLTSAGAARDWFVSDVSPSGFSVQEDNLAGGTNDLTAAQSFANGVYFAEFKHPLCSSDTAHDICVTLPAQVGFTILYAPDGQTGSEWPAGLFQVDSWANLTFPAPPPPQPTINLTTGDNLESIKLLSNGAYLVYYNVNRAGSFRLSVPANDGGHQITSASFPSQLVNGPGWEIASPDALGETFFFPQAAPQPDSFAVTSTDSNNLTSPPRTVGFQSDQFGPTGAYSCQPIGCSNASGPVRVTVHVNDNGGSGVAQVFYRTDGGAALDGGTPIANGGSFLVTSNAQVVIGAVDNVGNQTATVASGNVNGKPFPASMTWNYATDFQDQSNPGPDLYGNAGVWRYGEAPVATQHDSATYTTYPDFTQSSSVSQDCWHSATLESLTPDDCVVVGTVPPGTDIDPASTRVTFIQWTSPISGAVAVTGGFADEDSACGDGVDWFVDKNGTTIASGIFGNGGSQAFPGALAKLAVASGDTLTFGVGPGPTTDFVCDSTKADITITQVAASGGSQPSATSSTPSAAHVMVGSPITDTATVTANGTSGIPTGSVTFSVCGPLAAATGCATGGSAVGNAKTLDGSGAPVTSDAFTPSKGGTYCFRADYGGDGSFAASSDGTSAECFDAELQQTGPTYTVNTADDHANDATGCTVLDCSLHEAIQAANAAGVPAVIHFAILSGPQTIHMNLPLPTVTVPLTIDGTSQPGGIPGQPPITLDATGIEIVAGENQDGLVFQANGDSVSGLALANFPGNGVVVDGGTANKISGNVIGSDAAGATQAGNRKSGIAVIGASGTQIVGNDIQGSADAGILISGGSTGTIIHGNEIGTNPQGDPSDNGNAGGGVRIDTDSPGNAVGGTNPGDGNRIADNGVAGVIVASNRNPILGNSIEANAFPPDGIDLGATGNQLQAPPLLAAARQSGNSLTIVGKFLTPGGSYRLEYFLNQTCTSSETGVGPNEGATFIGSSQVVVNAGGEAAINATIDMSNVSPDAGSIVTATATSATNNTSEFSKQCINITQSGTATGSTISLSPDTTQTKPGAFAVPTNDIPPSAFASSPDAGGGTSSAPLGAIPLGAIPLGAIPLGAIPLGAIPLGAIGLTPQALLQDGLGGVPLNSIPLNPPKSWDAELRNTPLAGLPTQTLTLRDVLLLNPLPPDLQPGAATPITLKDVNLSLSPLGAIPLGAIALGSTPLGAIPIGGASSDNATNWCAQIHSLPGFSTFDCTNLGAQTVAGVALQGVPLGAIPLGAIPLGAIPLGAIPLGAIPLGAIALANTPLGAIPLGAIDFPSAAPLGAIPLGAIPLGAIPLGAIPLGAIPVLSAVVDCSVTTGGFSCTAPGTTLADALHAGAIKPNATLADLGTYSTSVLSDLVSYLSAHPEIRLEDIFHGLPPGTTLQDLLASLTGGAPASWEHFPLAGLQAFAGKQGAQGGLVTYSANFSITGSGGSAVATIDASLASGAFYVPGSSLLTDNTGTPVTTNLADPAVDTDLTWSLPTLNYGDSYTLKFKVRPGFELGNETTNVTLTTNGTTPKSAAANVTVGDTFESNDAPTGSPAIAPSTLYVSYLGNGKDVDYSTFHIDPASAPPGTRIKIFLSHLTSDDDLAVFGPVEAPLRSAPLGAIPLGAIATGDQPVQLGEASQQLAADTAQDLPFGVLPPGDQLLGVSDNRGTADEEVDFTSTGQTGDLLIQVSSYDGHPTTDPYVIRVEEDLPPALPTCTQTAPTGSVPSEAALPTNASIPSTAQTLILFNEQRLGQYYNAADAHTVYTKLVAYAARSDVNGVIVPVEKDPTVAGAYTTWNGALCSPAAANGVVRAIGHLLDTLQAGHPNLKTVMIVGADNVIPMARLSDQTQQANELGFESNFGFTNNEYVGAVAAGDLLSDDPYADPDPQAFIGGFLYVPKLSLGRLVETPGDISRQLDAYTTSNGLVNPQTKLVTGYDFLTDGSQAVNTALGRTAPNPNLISDTWTADQVRSELFPATGAQPLIDSLNAHYDQHRALSAQGNTLHNETDPYLFTSTNIASKGAGGVLGRIVFTMGCHAGFSLFDNLNYGATASSDFTLDWPQAYMEGGAIEFMGNTGFGLGDTATVAYSERLNQLFAARLNGTMTIGEALEFAKQEYVGDLGVVSLYDAKVGNEATLFGIPTYRLGTGTPPAAPSPPPTHTDSATGLVAQDFAVSPTFTLQSTASLGSYFTANDPNGLGTQVTNRRPIEPLTSFDITEPGTIAHGVLITSLVSHNVAGAFHAAFSRVADDSSSIEPQLQGVVDFPASIQSVATVTTPNGQQQRAVLIAGHFASGSSSGVGTQRLYDTIGGTVLYSNSGDFNRPTIRNVQITQIGSTTVGFAADVADANASGGAGTISEAIVLYLDGSNTWRRANLTCSNGRCTGGGPITGSQLDYIVEAVDAAGNVGVNANKAATANVAPPSGSGHISLTITGATQTNGWYTGPVTARLASDTGASLSFSLDGASYQDGNSVGVSTDGLHTLDARGSDGTSASFVIPVDVSNPTIRLSRPLDGQTYLSTDTADYSCSDAGSGIAANGCVGAVANGAPLPPTNGVATFTVTATDNVGRSVSVSVTYTVWPWSGFFTPVDNPPTVNVASAGSGVPVKFSLGGNRGLTFLSPGYPASQKVACDSGAPQDAIEQTVSAGSSSLSFDPTTNQYTYVWKTDKSWAGTCRDLTLLFPSGSVKTAHFKFK